MAKSLLETPWAVAIDPARRDGRIVAEASEEERRARTVALPRSLDPGFAEALQRAGIERLYSHQRQALEAAAGSNLVDHQRHRLGQEPRLQPAGARRHRPRRRSAAPSTSTRPRRWPRTRRASSARCARRACARRSTTATRRARSGRRSAAAATSSSPTPTCSTSASCPTTRAGATSSPTSAGSSSTRPTPTAASSAPTSPTCCGGCGGWRAPTAPSRASCSPRRRSPTRSSWPSGWSATPFELIDDDGAPGAGREIAMWNPPLIDKATGTRRSALSEAAELLAELVSQGVRTICFLKSRRGIELIQRFAREELRGARQAGAGGADRPLPRRLHAAAAARDRGAARRPASCSRWSPPTRWSWGSTSASSTRRSASPSPARSPACARCGAGPGAGGAGSPSTSPAQDALDQFFCRHPEEFIERPVEAAILDHDNEQIASRHLVAAAYELPLGDGGRRGLRRAAGASGPSGWSAAGELRSARRPAAAAPQRVRRREDPAALGLGRLGRGDRARLGRDARPGRGRARLHDDPPRRDLPPPRPLLRGRAARRRRAAGGRLALRRRLVHAAEEGDRDLHRAGRASSARRSGSSCTSARSR